MSTSDSPVSQYAELRREMVEQIARHTQLAAREIGKAVLSDSVMQVMQSVPRHEFVPVELRAFAYSDCPLPIGYEKTISQPFIVALMTNFADIGPGDKVLEVGTGCGYQAAVLAELAQAVYTIEIMTPLGHEAAERLTRLGYANVTTKVGDGYQGWPEYAPFDAIVVTAAPREVPQPLIDQLKPGGKLVVPVGGQIAGQSLLVLEKAGDGTVRRREVLGVRFVPLVDHSGRQQ